VTSDQPNRKAKSTMSLHPTLRLLPGLACALFVGYGHAAVEPPVAAFTANCASCHALVSGPFTGFVKMPPQSSIAPVGAAQGSGSGLKSFLSADGDTYDGSGTMKSLGTSLSQADADAIWQYLVDTRDGTVSPASQNFGSVVVTASGSTVTFTITNQRTTLNATFSSAPQTSSADFRIVGGSCTPLTSLAPGGSCTVQVQFTPTGAQPTPIAGSLSYTFDSPWSVDRPGDAQAISAPLSGTWTPQLSVTAAQINFGSVVATTTAVRSTIVSNLGGASFQLTGFSFTGGSAALYTLAPSSTCTPGITLAAGGSCQLDVQFAPTAAGANLNATLHIAHTAVGTASPQDIALLGAASPAPQSHIVLSAQSLTFPDTQLGSTASQPQITVQNDGTAALNFSAFTFGGMAAADYSRGGTCAVGTQVPINGTCTISVTFQPSALGARPASLTVVSDASNGPAVIALSGNGVPVPAPVASLLPATLDFGSQTLGGVYPPRSVTLANVGTAAMAVNAIAVVGAGFSNVSAAACPSSLAPGASCTIDIAFAPAAANTDYNGTLSVTDNAAGSPHTVALTGHGTATAVPVLAWAGNPTSLDLGLVNAGTVSAPQTATLVNQGPGGATLSLVNIVGTDAAAFVVVGGTCAAGVVLFEGNTCTVSVVFAPAAAGARSAALQVASTGSAPPTLALTGTGLGGPSPALALSAATLTFADTRVGASSAPLELTLSGSGSGVVTVTAMVVSGPFATQTKTCPSLPFALPAGSSCSVTVVFQPQAEGTATGTLTVTSDAQPGSQAVTLGGNGQPAPDLSSGGCSLSARGTLADPTLWVLALAAVLALAWRALRRRDGPGDR
jgi:hypothetical protein